MLSLFRPGTGPLHRAPAGVKLLLTALVVLALSLLPATWWAIAVCAAAVLLAFGLGRLGWRTLGERLWSTRWVAAITAVGQLVFLGPAPAAANTARVVAILVLASLLALTTPAQELLATLERGLAPLRRLGADPARASLLVMTTIHTVAVLGRLAASVREAQRARGARAGIRTFAVPFLVLAFRHADELGDALAARGVD
ncbi:energy-coupling factor transporter transmembrane component T family protein [Homoserinibacter sp. YIM 151385]|uniref:energy-coupling factor transporter transmembrane component T family protein n=1 Tax=Homoserinibacter sp. YIM 151385 TaxID=2985506 RepID=UPI0022F082F1|nr:energy-coupling factor transporter transmembrane component T [Homoserinibacter sp. YIM 151385]WBU38782.1 energy-coupling factor transporter transmembrane component T [Homoserinibacter sp. YIM 151385]